MQSLIPAVVALAAFTTTLPAAAQFRNADSAIKYRQSVMSVQNFHFSRLYAMANGKAPFDAKVAAEDAAVLEAIDGLALKAFIKDSEKGERRKTEAKPAVWTDRAKFDKAAADTQVAVRKLAVAAKTGDLAQIKPAVGTVADACQACHDNFRNE